MRKLPVAPLLILALSVFFTTATWASDNPPLTTFVMRDRKITITNTPNGLAYTVSSIDGKVLDDKLNDAQLQAKYPEVYDAVRPAMADGNQTNPMMSGGTEPVPKKALLK
ncbi:hypothetical protein NUACC21_14920 [Scytonema sp. NUACC21]